jgi:hypothetical protein
MLNKLVRWNLFIVLIGAGFIPAQFIRNEKQPLSNEEKAFYDDQFLRQKKARNDEFQLEIRNAFLQGSENTPVISLVRDRECLITIGEFNSRIDREYSSHWNSYLEFVVNEKPSINSKELQERILFSILTEAFLKDKWDNSKTNRSFNDSLKSQTMQITAELRKGIPESILSSRYKKYFEKLFSKKNNSRYYVLCSTDSLLLDSVLSSTRSPGYAKPGNPSKPPQKTSLFKKGYSSYLYAYDSLPSFFKKNADPLSPNKWSAIIKIPWGYCVLGLYLHDIRPEISFYQAIPQLVYLPDEIVEPPEVPDDSAREFFNSNENLFQIQDTLFLSIKMVPYVLRENAPKYDTVFSGNDNIKSVQCTSVDLPSDISGVFNLTDLFVKNNCTEWMDLNYGKWKFCLHKRLNGNKINFAGCRELVKNYIRNARMEKCVFQAASIAEMKENARSYDLFTSKYMSNLITNAPNDTLTIEKKLRTEIEKWASMKVMINFPK